MPYCNKIIFFDLLLATSFQKASESRSTSKRTSIQHQAPCIRHLASRILHPASYCTNIIRFEARKFPACIR